MAEREFVRKQLTTRVYPMAADTKIERGEGIVLNATGYAEPASVATTLTSVGIAEREYDNTGGADGDVDCVVHAGSWAYAFANSSAADEITKADVGDTCYWAGPGTVAKTNGASTRSAAGKVHDVDDQGVWVRFD